MAQSQSSKVGFVQTLSLVLRDKYLLTKFVLKRTFFNLFFIVYNSFLFVILRDGQSGKLTVDDYGAKTGRSPGKMRQLNINGPLYVGGCLLIQILDSWVYIFAFFN